jgi:hypothetical protein
MCGIWWVRRDGLRINRLASSMPLSCAGTIPGTPGANFMEWCVTKTQKVPPICRVNYRFAT